MQSMLYQKLDLNSQVRLIMTQFFKRTASMKVNKNKIILKNSNRKKKFAIL